MGFGILFKKYRKSVVAETPKKENWDLVKMGTGNKRNGKWEV